MSWFTVMLFRIQEKYLIISSGAAKDFGPSFTGVHSFFSFFASGAASPASASSALRFSPTSAAGTSSGFVSSDIVRVDCLRVRSDECRRANRDCPDAQKKRAAAAGAAKKSIIVRHVRILEWSFSHEKLPRVGAG